MTIALSLILTSALSLALLLWVARGRRHHLTAGVNSLKTIKSVDIEAFRNLIDPAEEEFLRTQLLPKQYRRVRRQRLLATLDYVRWTSHNASILVRMGDVARQDADPQVASAGQRLVNDANQLRLLASLAIVQLWVGIALPVKGVSSGRLVDHYQQLSGMARQLAVMRRPAPVGLATR